jgi:hypothetical protein
MRAEKETSADATLAADCRTEVFELHRFVGWWLRGEVPDTDAAFSLFPDALAEEFVLVSPSGRAEVRAEVLARIRAAHGEHADPAHDYALWVRELACRPLGPDHAFCTYEEWHSLRGVERGRRSTALLRREPGAPNGVVWEHVHETWLPER